MSDSEKKAAPGWYVDARWPGELRRWDGKQWLDQWRPVQEGGPGNWILMGLALGAILGVLTGVVFSVDREWGWVALWVTCGVAGTVFNIGMIGKAVEIGVRAARS